MKKTLLLTALLAVLAAAALLTACGPSNLTITNAWARPSQKDGVSAVYLVVTNPAPADDSLISIHGDVAKDIRPHTTITKDDGTTSMQEVRILTIKARGKATFIPGGLHVMLTGLTRDLKVGDTFLLTFVFQKAGAVQTEVIVKEQ
jgi:copper(I)-binding protein